MTWKVTVELEDQQIWGLMYDTLLRQLSDKLGLPEIKEVDGKVVCEYKDVPDFTKVDRIVFSGIELERTPGEVAVSG